MARVCNFCSKRPQTGNLRSHSNIKTRTRWLPNLKKVKHFENGSTISITVCTRCIKTGLVVKPPVRAKNWATTSAQA